MKEFPVRIELEDSWFEWEYNKFQELLKSYREALNELESIEHEATKPTPCKSWIKDYYYGDEPCNMVMLWTQIFNYIKDNSEKEGWTYSHLSTEQVDVNTDPYDEYENLTDEYTVYAVVEKEDDFKEGLLYKQQKDYVQKLYNEVISFKQRLDDKLKSMK